MKQKPFICNDEVTSFDVFKTRLLYNFFFRNRTALTNVITAFGATPIITLNEFIPLYVEYVAICSLIKDGLATSMSVQSIMILLVYWEKGFGKQVAFFNREGINVIFKQGWYAKHVGK